jgi:hypothetical protein
VRAAWEELDTDHRRRIIASVVDHVEVKPATIRHRFDPSRIVIHWKG